MLQRMLLLVGGPHAAGTSAILGAELVKRMPAERWDSRTLLLQAALGSDDAWRTLVDAVRDADLIVLSAPLYVDALPAATTRALELLAEELSAAPMASPPRLAVIMNCGYPEARQNALALEICRRFAVEAGLDWAGGLGFSSVNRQGPGLRQALGRTAAALDEGRPVPPEVARQLERIGMPAFLFVPIGNNYMRQSAREYGQHKRLDARPYAPSEDERG